MNSTIKKAVGILSVLILVLSGLPVHARALDQIDQDRQVAMTLRFFEDPISQTGAIRPVKDAQFELYYVAEVEGYGNFTLTGDFENYPITLEELDTAQWREITQTLLYYAQRDNLQPMDAGLTNAEGNLTFPNHNPAQSLEPGLYLVKALPKDDGRYLYQAESFLTCLPGMNPVENKWDYHPTLRVKFTKEEKDPLEIINRRVLKVWEGDEEAIRPKEVKIDLMKNGQVHDTVTLSKENNWRHLWQGLPRYDDQEELIDWSVVEQDVEDYKPLVKLEQITFVVTNTYDPEEESGETVRRVVQKFWDDKGYESKRPGQVTVYLLKNGEKHDTQILSSSNGWKYTWEDLPAADKDGKEIKWTVTEETVSGYVLDVVQKGENFLLTNAVAKPNLPQTGVLWWPVPILITAGLFLLILGRILKGRRRDE